MNNPPKYSHFIAVEDKQHVRIGAFGNNTWEGLKYIDITYKTDGNVEISYYDYKILGEEIKKDYSKNYNEVFNGIGNIDVFLDECGKCVNENKSTNNVCNDCLLIPKEIKEKLFIKRSLEEKRSLKELVDALKR